MPERLCKYELLRFLGRGSYGEVWEAKHLLTDEVLAVKLLTSAQVREAKLLRQIQHPNIIRIYDVDLCKGKLLIAMELGERSLRDRLGPPGSSRPLAENEAGKLFQSLAEGLDYLHARGMIHGDLKPSNIIFVSGVPKLADFGMARVLNPEATITLTSRGVGNIYYPAEAFISSDEGVLRRAEVYALARIMVEVFTGKLHELRKVPERYRELIRKMLSPDYQERPSIHQVIEYLSGARKRRRDTGVVEIDRRRSSTGEVRIGLRDRKGLAAGRELWRANLGGEVVLAVSKGIVVAGRH